MNTELRALSEIVQIRKIVDHKIVVMFMRGLLIDASDEKISAMKEMLSELREQFESVACAKDDGVPADHAGIALAYFEQWATEFEHMLHVRRRG